MLEETNKTKSAWWQPAMEFMAQISGWIVAPLLLAMFLGKYLDERFSTTPWWYIGCVAIGFVVINIGLVITTLRAKKKMEQISRDEKNINK